jgi:cytochrome c oxidase subunit 3
VNLFRELMAKPWMPAQARVDDLHDGSSFSLPAAKLGLRVFLCVVTVLFLLLILAYGVRMEFEDWRPQPPLALLWLNTAVLLLSSAGMQWAQIAVRRSDIDGVWAGLLAGGLFAIAFLAGQTLAWRQLSTMLAFDMSNPAVSFFYLVTALHALHIVGGLVAWGRTTARIGRGLELERARLSVELCTIYWHFMLLVWLILFGLLFSGNDNLGILLALCGLR